MKIKTIHIEALKKLKDFHQEVEGKNIYLCGENEVGKSTVIQSIKIASGLDTNIPPGVEGKGYIIGTKDDGDYTFEWKVKDGKSVVRVTDPNGMRDERKQTLKAITSAVSFDIEEFVKLSESKAGKKKQVEIVKSFLDDDVREELEKMERNAETLYNERTEANKDLVKQKTLVNSSPLAALRDSDLEAIKPVDTSAVLEELNKITEHNTKIDGVAQKLEVKKSEKETKEKRILELQLELDRLKDDVHVVSEDIKKGETWLSANKTLPTEHLQEQIKNSSEANKKASDAEKLLKDRKLLSQIESDVESLTIRVEVSRQAISDSIKDMCDSILPGLMFNDEGLIYEGLPVEFGSMAESSIMILGAKMFMAKNREFGVLMLENTNLIGQKKWDALLDWCESENIQVIAEEVVRGQDELTVVEITRP